MTRKHNGFDLEIIPAHVFAHSGNSIVFETILELHKLSAEEDANRAFTDVDYHNHKQAYVLFFIARLNHLSIQEEDTGMAFLEYQYQRYFSEELPGFTTLLTYLQDTQHEHLYPEAMECIARFLVRRPIKKKKSKSKKNIKNEDLDTITELGRFYLLQQLIEQAGRGEEVSEMEMIRLFLLIKENQYYSYNKTEITNNANIGKGVFDRRGALTKEQKKQLDEHLSTWKSMDRIVSFKL